MVRSELFDLIRERLASLEGTPVLHIDLWNEQVAFIEQESAWPMPAVFVEFKPIRWEQITGGQVQRAHTTIHLHIVTEWTGSETMADSLTLSHRISLALEDAEGDLFRSLHLAESHTCHNHEQLLETIDVYETRVLRRCTE